MAAIFKKKLPFWIFPVANKLFWKRGSHGTSMPNLVLEPQNPQFVWNINLTGSCIKNLENLPHVPNFPFSINLFLGTTVVIDCVADSDSSEDLLFWMRGQSFVDENSTFPVFYNETRWAQQKKPRDSKIKLCLQMSPNELVVTQTFLYLCGPFRNLSKFCDQKKCLEHTFTFDHERNNKNFFQSKIWLTDFLNT